MRMPSESTRRQAKLATEPADKLFQLSRTLLDEPLGDDEWKLYEEEVIEARGSSDAVSILSVALLRTRQMAFFKSFFSGNASTGKSTEMTRLLRELAGEYRGVRIDIREFVNPSDVEAHEILLAIVFGMTNAMIEAVQELDLQQEPDQNIVERIWQWTLETEYVTTSSASIDLTAGWQALKTLGITVTGQARASHAFTKTVREKQRQRFSELVALTNLYLANCYEILQNTAGQPEWLIIIEELDKSPNLEKIKEITTNAALFPAVEAHIICNIPQVAKAGERLALEVQPIYDVPIFLPDHEPDSLGIKAMRHALLKRANESLFEDGQIERLVIASGGNFRTLFRTVDYAGIQAFIRLQKENSDHPDAGPISHEDATQAINSRRAEYRDRLGDSGWDDDPVPIKDKLERLRDIYHQAPYHDLSDKVLSKLLQAGAVQVFNGVVRLTVHPLVVDILAQQGLLSKDADGFIAGGSI